jgi:type VI secretion system lysozyme-like protein
MAELSLRERLQPALLDRLVDDERLLTIYEFTFERGDLSRLRISDRDIAEIIAAQGLTPAGREGSAVAPESNPDVLRLRFSAPVGRMGLSPLKELLLKPPGAPQGVKLESFCDIEAYNVLNDNAESADRRYVNMRRLREHVCRDLAILLNSTNLEASVDLSALPYVQRSVVNYGIPSLAGQSVSSMNLSKTARAIEDAIRTFEPRLVKVRVTPDTDREAGDEHEISFRIDAELWGQPAPQQLVLRTHINTESGDVRVSDSGMK